MTGIVIQPPAPIALTPGEVELLRERIEAKLRSYAPDTRRVYGSTLRIFSRWFSSWIYDAPPEIQRRLGDVVVRMRDEDDWWPLIEGMLSVGAIIATTVASEFLEQTQLEKPRNDNSDKKPSTATRALRIAGIRWPFALMRDLNVITWDLRSVKGPKVTSYRDVHGPDVDQIRRMLEATIRSPSHLIQARDVVIVRLAFRGLRRSEIAEPLVGHYLRDRSPAALSILGKARDDRELISIPSATSKAIDAYLSIRGPLSPQAPLVARHDYAGDGLPMSPRSVYERVRVLGERAGVTVGESAIGPHKLRRSAITSGLDATGGDLRAVQAFGRHSRADVTMRYDDHRVDAAGRVAQILDDLLDSR